MLTYWPVIILVLSIFLVGDYAHSEHKDIGNFAYKIECKIKDNFDPKNDCKIVYTFAHKIEDKITLKDACKFAYRFRFTIDYSFTGKLVRKFICKNYTKF